MNTYSQFSLESAEKNYRAALALPSDSPTRALRTEEYIWALETALHGSSMGKVYGLNPAVATRGVA